MRGGGVGRQHHHVMSCWWSDVVRAAEAGKDAAMEEEYEVKGEDEHTF